jgi:uncharacterized damage-inducible protein DinB
MELDRAFLDYSGRKLRQLTGRISECLDKLTYDQIWARGNDEQNAIGNLVLHLCGNVRQWIGFGVAGKPDIRARAREFSARGEIQPEELRGRLNETVEEAVAAIEAVTAPRLSETIQVQAFEITVLEAIYHVVEHFSHHTGQIIYATKLLTGKDTGFYAHLYTPGGHEDKTP